MFCAIEMTTNVKAAKRYCQLRFNDFQKLLLQIKERNGRLPYTKLERVHGYSVVKVDDRHCLNLYCALAYILCRYWG